LRTQWAATPFTSKLAQWIKWGFRVKYPPFLGNAPSRRNRRTEYVQHSSVPFAVGPGIGGGNANFGGDEVLHMENGNRPQPPKYT